MIAITLINGVSNLMSGISMLRNQFFFCRLRKINIFKLNDTTSDDSKYVPWIACRNEYATVSYRGELGGNIVNFVMTSTFTIWQKQQNSFCPDFQCLYYNIVEGTLSTSSPPPPTVPTPMHKKKQRVMSNTYRSGDILQWWWHRSGIPHTGHRWGEDSGRGSGGGQCSAGAWSFRSLEHSSPCNKTINMSSL